MDRYPNWIIRQIHWYAGTSSKALTQFGVYIISFGRTWPIRHKRNLLDGTADDSSPGIFTSFKESYIGKRFGSAYSIFNGNSSKQPLAGMQFGLQS